MGIYLRVYIFLKNLKKIKQLCYFIKIGDALGMKRGLLRNGETEGANVNGEPGNQGRRGKHGEYLIARPPHPGYPWMPGPPCVSAHVPSGKTPRYRAGKHRPYLLPRKRSIPLPEVPAPSF
jgi:hypothetical protein